ncbi:hypothetical protein RI570_07165 [Brucella pseudogrignonensis]|uniref:hypothetical protein n=1 Tax=Brucella pseudogrignonensis TaxID=419475 RepID=UPI0028BADE02|nr:hypothetical protein [Brucella pseudogrignonensis]MDT6939920.1 hypothetical protein [Brucella pseudogrignonensis]
MTDTFDYIMRFAVIVFGYCIAVLAAGFFLAAILYSQVDVLGYALSDPFFEDVFTEIRNGWDMTGFYAAVLVGGPVLAVMAGGFSFFPALALIVVSEVRGWKSSLPYSIGGLIIGLIAIGAGSIFTVNDQPIDAGIILLTGAFACSGIVGGFVYWLIAGRNAGRFLARPAQ